ncbi:major facilitator superfamily domain-containing protein [Zychaea mexicana]|uniref:major facilitator superfamily domain-containing protein n=1 Tax=Zychaea mexicana TaxID=64656 RepID=UPI0022FE978B|nr:major facilitator superfamily domain-containing protein [Zychaea mexicana]KAI9492104.1 major facilitator superfamily domain-containing protein [Zychaea mexicana]
MSLETQPLLLKPDEVYRDRLKEGGISLGLLTFCLCTGSILAAADNSIVYTIFTEIGTEFKSSNLTAWILTSYLLSSSALQPLYAKLSDVFGRKTILLVVNMFFFIGSAACGASQNILQLSIARAIAGLGGGGLMCMASVVIHDLVPMRQRGKYQSYVNMTQTIGGAVGAPLGGWINDTVGWRTCFYLNLPPCLFALYIYSRRLPNYNNLTKGRLVDQIDAMGAAILLVANSCFVLGTSSGGNTRKWSDPWVVTVLGISVTAYLVFFINEFTWARNPLMSCKMAKNRNVLGSCASNFFLWGTVTAINYVLPQFLMGILGYSTSSTGFWVMPRTIAIATGCWCVGKYIGTTGRYKNYLVITMMLDILAVFGMILWKPTTDDLLFKLMCMLMEGFAMGSVAVGTMVSLVADIDHEDTASATSMIFLFRSTGLVTGGSIAAAIVQGSFKSLLEQTIHGPDAKQIIDFVRGSIADIGKLNPEIQRIVIDALYRSLRRCLVYGFIMTVLSFVAVVAMKNCYLQKK